MVQGAKQSVPQPRYALRHGSNVDSDIFSVQFKLPRFHVYHVICDILEGDGRVTEALECFRQMQDELPEDTSADDGRAQWELGKGFQPRHRRG